MRRLLLHIGSHKTGTTAIQDWFHANKEAFAAKGVSWAEIGKEYHVHPALTFYDPAALQDFSKIFPDGFRLANSVQFARMLASLPGETVIASSENFSFFFRQEAIDDVAAAVRPLFDEVRIVAYLRRQDRHAVSHHAEGARPDRPGEGLLWGHSVSALPKPGPYQASYLDYNQRIAKWEHAFGSDSLMVRVYDRKLLKDGNVIPDFLDLVGLSGEGMTPPISTNTGLDQMRSKAGHVLKAIEENDELAQLLLRTVPASDGPAKAHANAARAFLRPYRDSNRLLNERLKINALPELFPDDFDDMPTGDSRTWTDEEVNGLMRSLVTLLVRRSRPGLILSTEDLLAAANIAQATAPKLALRLLDSALLQKPTGTVLKESRARVQAKLDRWQAAREG